MKLSEHFDLDEFTHSAEAVRRGIINDPPIEFIGNLRATAAMLERIRDFLMQRTGRAVPMLITSGYRCLPLNRAVGSADASDHVLGCAADWRAPMFGSPLEIARFLAPHVDDLGIGQLINEFPEGDRGWVHTSTRRPMKMVNRIITIKATGTFVGVVA